MLEKNLLKRLFYAKKKYKLIQSIKTNSYRDNYKTINEIREIISKEILVNTHIRTRVRKLNTLFGEKINNSFIIPLKETLKKRNKLLTKEFKSIAKINHFNMIAAKIESIFYKNTHFFANQIKLFKSYYQEEIELNKNFQHLMEKTKFPEEITKKKNGFMAAYETMALANKEIHQLAEAVGNTKLVQKRGKHLLKTLDQIKKTEMYEFIQKDVDFVIKKVKEVVENPKENKLKITLFGIYLVAPTTFEATFVIMLLRYTGKVTISKTKKVVKKLKKDRKR